MLKIKSDTGEIKINMVEESLFTTQCEPDCLKFEICRDVCCSYGCDITNEESTRILEHKDELEKLLKVPAQNWFRKRRKQDSDYPSGEFRRSRVHRGKCVFYAHDLRGCMLHRLAVNQGFDPHLIKPMVCFLFPATWDNGQLMVAGFLSELPCRNRGIPIFESQKKEVSYYFGQALVHELEKNAEEYYQEKKKIKG